MGSRLRLLAAFFACIGVSVTAATAATPLPKLQAATVVGDRVNLTFTGALKPGAGAWTVVVNGRPVTGSRAVVSGKRVQLVLPRPVYGDDTMRVVGRALRARSGARLRLVDVKPTVRSTAGCSEEVGSVAPGEATEGPTDRETFLGASRFDVLSVRVDFADAPANTFAQAAPMALETLDHWIGGISYGRSAVVGTTYPSTIRMAKNFVDYVHSGSWAARKTFFQDLVVRLDGEVDFARYDAIVVAMDVRRPHGAVGIAVEPFALAPIGSGLQADGREVRHFAVGNTIGLVQTLLRHAGLPVLNGGYATGWDLMAGPADFRGGLGLLAWHRRKLGWLGPTEVRCLRTGSIELTLEPTWRPGGVKALVVPTGRNSAIVLENRQQQGPDAGLCTKGILAYEVRADWQYQLWVIARDRTFDPACGHALSRATFDFGRGGSTRVTGATGGVSFEVLDVLPDGTYRLRVSR
jgi:hypothetical protein